jgi:LysR family nod box-dependent transcriptional activator
VRGVNLNRLDLNLLVALDALLELRHVSRAAEKLHVTQPAMSASLAKLRQHFDDPLLVPIGRQLHLTPMAEDIAGQVRSILTQVEGLLQARPSFDAASAESVFRVMASDYGLSVLIAELMRRLKTIAPRVGVEVVPFSDAPSKSLSEGQVDILVITRDFLAPGHPTAALFEDSFVCVGWRDNPELGDQLSLEQFLRMGHVVVKYGPGSIPHLAERFFLNSGIERRVEVTVTGYNSVPHLVVGTDRIALMHARLAAIYARQMALKLYSPPIRVPMVDQAMQWHSLRENDRASKWFRGQVLETARSIRETPRVGEGVAGGLVLSVG